MDLQRASRHLSQSHPWLRKWKCRREPLETWEFHLESWNRSLVSSCERSMLLFSPPVDSKIDLRVFFRSNELCKFMHFSFAPQLAQGALIEHRCAAPGNAEPPPNFVKAHCSIVMWFHQSSSGCQWHEILLIDLP